MSRRLRRWPALIALSISACGSPTPCPPIDASDGRGVGVPAGSVDPRGVEFAPELDVDLDRSSVLLEGLYCLDEATGHGEEAAPGATLTVHYTGYMAEQSGTTPEPDPRHDLRHEPGEGPVRCTPGSRTGNPGVGAWPRRDAGRGAAATRDPAPSRVREPGGRRSDPPERRSRFRRRACGDGLGREPGRSRSQSLHQANDRAAARGNVDPGAPVSPASLSRTRTLRAPGASSEGRRGGSPRPLSRLTHPPGSLTSSGQAEPGPSSPPAALSRPADRERRHRGVDPRFSPPSHTRS